MFFLQRNGELDLLWFSGSALPEDLGNLFASLGEQPSDDSDPTSVSDAESLDSDDDLYDLADADDSDSDAIVD